MVHDTASPANPALLAESGLYEACRAFVLKYALPALDPANVVQGWQNRAALPPGTEDYAVISVLFHVPHGTPVEMYARRTGRLAVMSLVEAAVQVDFCAEDDTARLRAQRLATITRSSLGVSFFKARGLSALYADDARDISFVGDARQFVRRWMTTLRLTFVEGVSVDFEVFDAAAVSRLENVDVHHPANKE